MARHPGTTMRSALRSTARSEDFSRLGRKVKVMIGGMTGWADEGFSFASGEEPAE